MEIDQLFTKTLGIVDPWKIKSIEVDHEKKRLDIHIDFIKGATFPHYNEETGEVKKRVRDCLSIFNYVNI